MNKRKENLVGYAFVTPALLVFITLVAFPLFFSIFLSFTKWNFVSGWDNIKWIGLDNFKAMTEDKNFIFALKNTFLYSITIVPISVIAALVLAYVLNDKVYFKKTMRLFFFIPYISSSVALAAVFKALFREDGMINYILMNFFGMKESISWMVNSTWNKLPIIIFTIWVQIGFELIIYMAALQNVPKSLYEAAEIDGANSWQKFWRITFPMISPTTFYLIVVQFITVFKIFNSIDIMTFGNISFSNTSMVVEIYQNAFKSYNFGYASAEALVLMVIIMIITAINFWGQKKWVHY